ncbi:MAG TPA: MlaD family protein [Rhodanobacteraceae bacterium]
MENRAHAIIAACFLLLLTAVLVVIFVWLSSSPKEPLVYRIVTSESVAGLAPQSTVEFKGLPVGHVTHVGFDPDNHAQVVINFSVRQGTYMTHATYAVLTKHGLTGGEVLELKLGKGSDAPLATSVAYPAQVPLRQGLLGQLEASAQTSMHDLQAVLASAKQLLDAGNRAHITASLSHIDAATAKLVVLENQLQPVLQHMPELERSARQSLDASHALLAQASALMKTAHAPVHKLGQVEDTYQQLGSKLDKQTLPDINALSNNLARTSRELRELIRALKARPQSVIFGPAAPAPGPGEPGFSANHKQGDGHD